MKRSIITRCCLLVAAVFLFAGATGCLDKTPFPEEASAYALKYRVGEGKLLVTFAPRTEVYEMIDAITNFSYKIARCGLLSLMDNGIPSGEEFSGVCDALFSDAAQNGNPIILSFDVPEDKVVDCGEVCKAKIVFEILVSGEAPDGSETLEDKSYTFIGPHFNPGIDVPFPFPPSGTGDEPEYLDLTSATMVEGCGDNEVWNVQTSLCDCADGYSRESATAPCIRDGGPSPEDNDADDDGILDNDDNCPNDANPGQEDADGDGIGDACEATPGTGRSSLSDIFGDGTCTLNAGASAGSHLGILSLLFTLSVVAVRRRFR